MRREILITEKDLLQTEENIAVIRAMQRERDEEEERNNKRIQRSNPLILHSAISIHR